MMTLETVIATSNGCSTETGLGGVHDHHLHFDHIYNNHVPSFLTLYIFNNVTITVVNDVGVVQMFDTLCASDTRCAVLCERVCVWLAYFFSSFRCFMRSIFIPIIFCFLLLFFGSTFFFSSIS